MPMRPEEQVALQYENERLRRELAAITRTQEVEPLEFYDEDPAAEHDWDRRFWGTAMALALAGTVFFYALVYAGTRP
jgi:hypothetical protein